MATMNANDRQPSAPGSSIQLAQERTILANERTYSGWIRTALACEGVGLGFKAILHDARPDWLPRLVAAAFILTGIMLILFAHQRAQHILHKLEGSDTPILPPARLGFITAALVASSCGVGVVIWILH